MIVRIATEGQYELPDEDVDRLNELDSAVETASQTLRDLRVAEVVEQDLVIEEGRIRAYRTKVKISFKYERGDA